MGQQHHTLKQTGLTILCSRLGVKDFGDHLHDKSFNIKLLTFVVVWPFDHMITVCVLGA